MRILHVVSLVDPEGSFGGPLRVAMNQLAELRRQGHEVLLAAGIRGYGSAPPHEFNGVPLQAFAARSAVPGTGFAGLSAPGMLPWLAKNATQFDAVHVHLARDLVSLPAAALLAARHRPFVAQTHGMVDTSPRRLAKVLDGAMTRRTLRAADTVFALTAAEERDLREVEPRLRDVVVLPNGVPSASFRADPAAANDVLFLARLAPRKRPADFVRAAQRIASEHPEVTFSLVGPDEGELGDVRTLLAQDDAAGRIRYEGAVEPARTEERMSRAAVYVLPAVEEPFGMTVVEAMSVGLPTVVRADCGLASVVAETGGAVVQEVPGIEQLATQIGDLMHDPERRRRAGELGRAYVHDHASMDAVVQTLLRAYQRAGRRSDR